VDLHSFFIASRERTDDGTLLFGSPEGLLLIQPRTIAPWTYAPPVVVTALRIDGVEHPGAARLTRLDLAPGDRGFRLDFAALDFTAPEKIAYRYRLDGFDARWLAARPAQGSLTYTNLAPGSYTLRVQGTNRAGRWSEHELVLPVTVEPALYQTRWFRAALAALVLALAYGAYRWRVRRLEARGRELERVVQERTRELADAYVRIEEASLTDPLTGLRNRRFLEQSIRGVAELAVRRHEDGHGEGEVLVFLLLDLDHFKSVNDTHGHAAGDAVLVQTAAVLRRVLRASDHAVRWGGEEFLAVARFIDRRRAPELAEKIRAAIAACPFSLPDGTVLHLTCSLGFAPFPFSGEHPRAIGWEEAVDRADDALYTAKRNGRDRWVEAEKE
jgi:diguanylate cyclase (GGDEF)-like protein